MDITNVLIQLGNKVPLAYFYTTLGLLIWHYSQNKAERPHQLIAANNLLYLGFSALTVIWFVPNFLKIITQISTSESIQGTDFHATILTHMYAYLFITILPTLLAIAFTFPKWRKSINWSILVVLWTSPFASLLLRKIWWDVKVVWKAASIQGEVFELNFFKHLDGYMVTALFINIAFLGIYCWANPEACPTEKTSSESDRLQ